MEAIQPQVAEFTALDAIKLARESKILTQKELIEDYKHRIIKLVKEAIELRQSNSINITITKDIKHGLMQLIGETLRFGCSLTTSISTLTLTSASASALTHEDLILTVRWATGEIIRMDPAEIKKLADEFSERGEFSAYNAMLLHEKRTHDFVSYHIAINTTACINLIKESIPKEIKQVEYKIDYSTIKTENQQEITRIFEGIIKRIQELKFEIASSSRTMGFIKVECLPSTQVIDITEEEEAKASASVTATTAAMSTSTSTSTAALTPGVNKSASCEYKDYKSIPNNEQDVKNYLTDLVELVGRHAQILLRQRINKSQVNSQDNQELLKLNECVSDIMTSIYNLSCNNFLKKANQNE